MFTIQHYETADGVDIFDRWFSGLSDAKAKAAVIRRIGRLEQGLFGDCKPLHKGVWEMRIDYGPGYRLYYSVVGRHIALLLCGGDKRKQAGDIDRAIEFLEDFKRRHRI